MNRHASMNRIYRLVWNQVSSAWVPVAETAKSRGKAGRALSTLSSIPNRNILAAAISLAVGSVAHAAHAAPPAPACAAPNCGISALSATSHPLGARVVSGTASITQAGTTTDIRQSSPDVSIDWLSFNIGSQASVDFMQPSASSVAVNRISGTNGSEILGHLDANGQVYLINPNGVVFGRGSQVNVGGLVASTLEVSDASLGNPARSFSGSGAGSVINDGSITATQGGYVALLGSHVTNNGVISAQLGAVALGAGSAVTLTFNDNGLVHLQVDRSVLGSLAANGGLIQANGGQVIMTAGAKASLLASVVNNTGVIEARTVEDHAGTITLLGGMAAGTVTVGGTLDASAPTDGNGGFIETSAAHVEVSNEARITTAAARGLTGSWLVDPQDLTVAPTGGDITGAALSNELTTTSVTLESSSGATAGTGSINVNDTVSWSANTLTLTAADNINVNGTMTATGSASLALNPSTANGSAGAVAGGTVVVGLTGGGFTGVVNFNGTGALSISGTPYTVINSLGVPGSTTGTDLQGMAGNLSGHYVLGSNIDASATSSWNGGAGFTPVGGSRTVPFAGTFDGLGHTVGNLYISQSSGQGMGLFGYGGSSAIIRNVGMAGGSVSGYSEVGGLIGTDKGTINNSFATGSETANQGDNGGLVGVNYGSITSSYATGQVTSHASQANAGGLVGLNYGSIKGSFASGAVSGGVGVGGLVGISDGHRGFDSISNSFATGNVSGNGFLGGLVGVNENNAGLSNSYATGSCSGSGAYGAGGLVGFLAFASINNSYATGRVTGTQEIGGLVGWTDYGQVTASYASGVVRANGNVGGLVGYGSGTVSSSYWNVTTSGQSSSDGGSGLTTAQMQSAANFAGFGFTTTPGAGGNNWVLVDADGTLNNAGGAVGAVFPMLASEYSITIGNAHQLQLMAMNPAAVYTLGQNINAAGTANGADVWGSSGFVPVGSVDASYFSGTFDGLGHTISNLKINQPSANDIALFGLTTPTSVIQNVGLIGGSMTGMNEVAGLVGVNQGSISNTYFTGTVNAGGYIAGGLAGVNQGQLSNSSSSASVTAVSSTGRVGGLVGYNRYGSINSSYATGTVQGSNFVGGLVGLNKAASVVDSYATGAVTGATDVGGLVGYNDSATISNAYATGGVHGTSHVGGLVGHTYGGSISNSYAAGAVSGSSYVGGLVGYSYGNTPTTGFWDMTTSGVSGSAGGIGMTTANMQAQANFTSATAANGNVNPNWDFANTWVMYDGFTYPLLRSFMTPLTVTANNASNTYNGSAYSGGNGVTYSVTPNANLLGTVSYGGSSQGALNVGSYAIAPGGLYSNQQGYIISYGSGTLTINPLASESWTGGTTGNWSTAADWSAGLVPDYHNVTAVTIPRGVTVTYDSAVPGSTVLGSLTSTGILVMAAGSLSTTGNFNTDGFEQTGGVLDVGGSLIIHSANRQGVELGDITAQSLNITSKAGAITQLASSALDVTGATTLTADNGVVGAGDVKYGISLADAANNFRTVISNGSNIDLVDGTGGIVLGNTTASGTLTVDSLAGSITEAAGKSISVNGTSSLTADNGVSGTGDLKYALTLANSTNTFGGAVTANGRTITLTDASALTANLTSTNAVTLTAAGAMNVAGTIGTTLTTVTTGGASSTTTFGTTTVASALNVTSTGAVSSTTTTALKVHGARTDRPNAHVTVNGVNDVAIP